MNVLRGLLVAYRRWRTPGWRWHRVACDIEGFSIISTVDPAAPPRRIRWTAVRHVEAFKRDFIAIELVCVSLSTEKETVEVNEKMSGWGEFLPRMKAQLPELAPEAEWLSPEMDSW